MKFCPKCSETYADDSLNFCLNDGTPLRSGNPSDQQTAVMNSRTMGESPTASMDAVRPTQLASGYAPSQSPQMVQPSRSSRTWLWVLGILALVVLLCGGGFAGLVFWGSRTSETGNKIAFISPTPRTAATTSTPDDDDDATPSPTRATGGDTAGDLTMAQYDKITIGMTRAEVEKIIGKKGSQISSYSGGGTTYTVDQWEGKDYKSIILSFQNDKVISKSQAGLK